MIFYAEFEQLFLAAENKDPEHQNKNNPSAEHVPHQNSHPPPAPDLTLAINHE